MSRHSKAFFPMLVVAFLLHLGLIAWWEFPKHQPTPAPAERSVVHMVELSAPQPDPVTTTQASPPTPETPPPPPEAHPQPTPPLSKPTAAERPLLSEITPPDSEPSPAEDSSLLFSATEAEPEPLPPQPKSLPPEKEISSQEARPSTAEQITTPTVHNPELRADYKMQLAAWIERHKRYPIAAQRRHIEGEILLRVRINREGRVLNFGAEGVSGHRILDEAALAIIERADPFPPFPPGLSGSEFEFLLPISFRLR